MQCLKNRSSSAGTLDTKSFHKNSLLSSRLLAKVCKYLYHKFFFLFVVTLLFYQSPAKLLPCVSSVSEPEEMIEC